MIYKDMFQLQEVAREYLLTISVRKTKYLPLSYLVILPADIFNWTLWNEFSPVKFLTGNLSAVKGSSFIKIENVSFFLILFQKE